MDIEKQIESIEKEIRETPYHKGTEHYIGLLRARLARLKDKLIEKEYKKGKGGKGYAIKKQGDATVVLVGPPSVGKSTLLNSLTNAQSKIAPYAFTTVGVVPGMVNYKSAKIQVLDVPGLIEGAEEGKGRGKEVLSVARGADLLIILSEPSKKEKLKEISDILEKVGIRINKKKPEVEIVEKNEGGIKIFTNIKQDISKETIKGIIQEMGVKNAEVKISQKIDSIQLIDALSKNRVYIPALYVVNKCDLLYQQETRDINNSGSLENPLFISAQKRIGLDILLDLIWQKLELLTVYLVKPGQELSHTNPLVVKNGTTLFEIAEKIGEEFASKVKSAHIWGNGAKFPNQLVSLETKACEGMMIRFD